MLLVTDNIDTNNDVLFELTAHSPICLHLYTNLGCILWVRFC